MQLSGKVLLWFKNCFANAYCYCLSLACLPIARISSRNIDRDNKRRDTVRLLRASHYKARIQVEAAGKLLFALVLCKLKRHISSYIVQILICGRETGLLEIANLKKICQKERKMAFAFSLVVKYAGYIWRYAGLLLSALSRSVVKLIKTVDSYLYRNGSHPEVSLHPVLPLMTLTQLKFHFNLANLAN